jgi:hypothetical protein
VILVPQFGAESAAEHALRSRILDDLGVPFVFVELDEARLLRGNLHPDAQGAGMMAAAIAVRLRAETANRFGGTGAPSR